ncbi:MAG TPA: hypothetical protein VFP05_18000 [Thermomicrobiales bacterium]|nr:hypothetical protein [Thermomicrobiales bacterium]
MPSVDCFLLVDSAQVANGKLFILGGGWARLTTTQIPITRTFETAIRVVVPWTETNRPHPLELQVENEDGQALLDIPVKAEIRVGRPAQLKDGTDQVVPLALRVGPVTLEREGRYALILRYEGEVTARTAFDLVLNRPAG